jgi:hypothetical protein
MAATVLSTPRAVEVSVYVVRAFVRPRELVGSRRELANWLDDLEEKTEALAINRDTFCRATVPEPPSGPPAQEWTRTYTLGVSTVRSRPIAASRWPRSDSLCRTINRPGGLARHSWPWRSRAGKG